MKTVTKERNSIGILLEWLWGVLVISGTTYLVFWKGASPAWYILACLLLTAELATKRTETDDELPS